MKHRWATTCNVNMVLCNWPSPKNEDEQIYLTRTNQKALKRCMSNGYQIWTEVVWTHLMSIHCLVNKNNAACRLSIGTPHGLKGLARLQLHSQPSNKPEDTDFIHVFGRLHLETAVTWAKSTSNKWICCTNALGVEVAGDLILPLLQNPLQVCNLPN